MIKRAIIGIFSSIFIYKIFFALNENNSEIFDYNNNDNNDKIKVSILIPVYNYEQYLRDCLDSVINQSLKNIQIICVDDGSTDNSGKILDEYAQKDKRIIVKHIKHVSIAETRNECLKYATGEYIGFVDADDFICKGGLSYVVEKANEYDADVAKFYMRSIRYDSVQRPIETVDTTHVEVIETIGKDVLMRCDIADSVVWDGIYRRTMLIENAIRFQRICICMRTMCLWGWCIAMRKRLFV